MREIKFRAWDKKQQIMVYDKDMYCDARHKEPGRKINYEASCAVSSVGIIWNCTTPLRGTADIDVDGKKHTFYQDWDATTITFEDIALMQYTGLKDKNGEKIYEGDILKDGSERYVVRFVVKKWASVFQLDHIWKGWLYSGNGNGIEIIGNIYENPELLDTKEIKVINNG